MIYIKIHKGRNILVAVCDEDLVGKEFHEGKLYLKISESFYKGELKTEAEVKHILFRYSYLNIVGKRSIALALELGIITQRAILFIQGVPHAQTISF